MAGPCLGVAKLDDTKQQKLHQLEEQIGTQVMAVEPVCHWTSLDDERLHKLQEVEEELGVILLAYQPE